MRAHNSLIAHSTVDSYRFSIHNEDTTLTLLMRKSTWPDLMCRVTVAISVITVLTHSDLADPCL